MSSPIDSLASESDPRTPPMVPLTNRLVCIGLATLATLSSAYESLLVDAPGILDGAWTLAYVLFVSIFINIPISLGRRKDWTTDSLSAFNIVALCFKSALEFPAILFSYVAIKLCPVGDAVALYNLSAVWTPLLECLIKRRRPTVAMIVSVVLTVAGVVLITRPHFLWGIDASQLKFDETYPNLARGYTFALAGSLCLSLSLLLVSYYENIHWTYWVIFFTPVGVVEVPFMLWATNNFTVPIVPFDPGVLLLYFSGFLVGVFSMMAQILAVLAVQVDCAATVSITCTLEIPFSYVLGLLFENEMPSYTSVSGALIITLAILILADVHRLCKIICDDNEERHRRTSSALECLKNRCCCCIKEKMGWREREEGKPLRAQSSEAESWATAFDDD